MVIIKGSVVGNKGVHMINGKVWFCKKKGVPEMGGGKAAEHERTASVHLEIFKMVSYILWLLY